MSKPLSGRIALVTGASRGIGRAAAIALGGAGAHVICVARTVGGLEETDDAIVKAGGTATLVPLNLKDFAAIDRLGFSARFAETIVGHPLPSKLVNASLVCRMPEAAAA